MLGNRTNITYQDVAEMKYCTALFKETLRFWPPVAFSNRVTNQEWESDGYLIPKNTSIFTSSYVSGRMEKYFKKPHEFNPERFLKDSETNESK